MATVTQIGPRLGIAPTCAALGLPRATYYRRRRPQRAVPPRRRSPRALGAGGARGRARACCTSRASWTSPRPRSTPRCSTRAGTSAPSARCTASWPRTHEVRERRDQLRHPVYAAPELLARRPNELWSWDITKLLGPGEVDLLLPVRHPRRLQPLRRRLDGGPSRERRRWPSSSSARRAPARASAASSSPIHADRGSSMTSKPVALLLADLGVTKTHSRPHVSNDNPFSEAQFKTLKYRPAFPERFGSIQDARAHCHVFFPWYNTEHHHIGLGLLTPADVHHGLAEQRVAARAAVLAAAYAAHPERFLGGPAGPGGDADRGLDQSSQRAARSRRWRSLTKLETRLSHSC